MISSLAITISKTIKLQIAPPPVSLASKPFKSKLKVKSFAQIAKSNIT